MGYIIETSFLNKEKYLWDRRVIKKMFNELESFQKNDFEESKERCFAELMLEFQQAYRLFLRKIGDLPMIMSCRVKGDSDSHFGGLECAELMKSFRFSSEKYLKQSAYSQLSSEGTIAYMALKIRDKAKEDEKYAWDFEKKLHQDYILLGIDNTLEILKKSGYKFNKDGDDQKTILTFV